MLKNKKILVTGAASGIGAETAKILRAHGATIIGVDLNKTKSSVDHFIQADLSNPKSIDKAIANVPEGVDALCNIAGLPPTQKPALVLKVNFLGLRYFTDKMIGKLNENASIVNVASLAGLGWPDARDQIKALIKLRDFTFTENFCKEQGIGSIDGRSYFLAKETLIVWTMINRWTWRDFGIRMNCVSPGPVDTPILPDFIETLGDRVEEDRRIMDRDGRPEDVAQVIAFLCSDASTWIRGANIPCDGGMYSHVLCDMHGHK